MTGTHRGRPVIVRIWRTRVQESRVGEYQDFARSRSLPMFRSQPGFAGVLFAAHGGEHVVISLWEGRAALDALDSSPTYRQTVAAIEQAGFLEGESTVEVLELEGAVIERHFAALGRAAAITGDDAHTVPNPLRKPRLDRRGRLGRTGAGK